MRFYRVVAEPKQPNRRLTWARGLLVAAGLGLAGALATLVGARAAAPLHDALGSLSPAPDLPVVIVRADRMAEAVPLLRAAGAEAVWIALPEGDPRAGEARTDPGTLRAARDGRVRFDEDRRLPLPEALRGLVRMDAEQLGAGTPPTMLAGREAVVISTDPALGRKEAAPGAPAPVDRGELLAVARGVLATGGALRTAPLALAMALVGGLSAAWGLLVPRLSPLRGVLLSGVGVALILGAALAARAQQVDLPVGGLLFAATAPALARLGLLVLDTARALERYRFALGSPPEEPSIPSGLAALPSMASLLLPGVTVSAWRRGAGGAPELAAEVRGQAQPLPLTELPQTTTRRAGSLVEPVRDGETIVGALVLSANGELPPVAAALGRSLGHRLQVEGALGSPEADPWLRQLGEARLGAMKLGARAARWESYLESSGAVVGAFGLAGELISGSKAMRDLSMGGAQAPLMAALLALCEVDEAGAREAARDVFAGDAEIRLPGRDPDVEVVLAGLGVARPREVLLVTAHDIRPHRRRDALKTSVISSTSFQTRNALAALSGYSTMMASLDSPERRRDLEGRVRALVQRVSELLDRCDAIVSADPRSEPLAPVHMRACVDDAVRALRPERRANLSLHLPDIDQAVTGRATVLTQAIHLLLAEATEGGNTRVTLSPESGGMRLRVEDDSGGLPAPLFQRLFEESTLAGAPAAARRAIEKMEGTFDAFSTLGEGTRFEIWLRYY